MSTLHESIVVALHAIVDGQSRVDIISPTSLAMAVQDQFAGDDLDPHIAYASLEHLKQMARRILGGRFETDSDESEAYQGELFSGVLQQRYPLPRKKGDDPVYKRLELLTGDELRWNIASLEKSADARTEHARALEAYRQQAAA